MMPHLAAVRIVPPLAEGHLAYCEAFSFYFSTSACRFSQRLKVKISLRGRKLAKFSRQYSQRHLLPPNNTFRRMKKGGSYVLPVHPFRSIRWHFGQRAKRKSESTRVLAMKRVWQSRQRRGEIRRSRSNFSWLFLGLDSRRNRLPQFGQETDIVSGVDHGRFACGNIAFDKLRKPGGKKLPDC